MKITTTFAEIVVHGTKDRPYYEIMYYDMEQDVMCVGYSSYYLDIVFEYLENYFNIVRSKQDETRKNFTFDKRRSNPTT